MKIRDGLILTMSALLTVATPLLAETYTIAPDGSGDFPTIQAALVAAQAGDIVELLNGTLMGEGNRDVDHVFTCARDHAHRLPLPGECG